MDPWFSGLRLKGSHFNSRLVVSRWICGTKTFGSHLQEKLSETSRQSVRLQLAAALLQLLNP